MNSVSEKTCPDCKGSYPATTEYFSRNRQRKDGLAVYCKGCLNARNAKWRNANSEQWSVINRTSVKQWRIDNPDKVKQQGERRDRTSPLAKAKRKVQGQKYRLAHPEKVRELSRTTSLRYLARKHHAQGNHNAEDVTIIYQSQKGLCWWCGKSVGDIYHVDHRIALSKGGTDNPSNLCISCPTCNCAKQGKMPWQFNGRLL